MTAAPRVGVHTSVRRGFAGAAEDAAALGCETLQIFTQSPRGWMTRVFADEEFTAFRRARERLALDPVVVHSPYLPNLCTSDEKLYRRSIDLLKEDLRRTGRLGAEYLVIHPGAWSPGATLETGLDRVGAALREAFSEVPGPVKVLIENMAGGGRRIGGPFREIAGIFRRAGNEERLGVCFDTCHAFGAGYDLRDEASVDATLSEFDREVGLDRIHVFHVNDSSGALKSHRDLHEHLGQGHIGEAGFRALFGRGRFNGRALILETPKDPAPQADLENLTRLRACLSSRAGKGER